MELVYLWVEDYKNIQKQGFNFSPRFRCEYDEDTKELNIVDKEETGEFYPKNFFGDNINVTAIVGENGSGKSNLIKCIGNNFNKKNSIYFNNSVFYTDFPMNFINNQTKYSINKMDNSYGNIIFLNRNFFMELPNRSIFNRLYLENNNKYLKWFDFDKYNLTININSFYKEILKYILMKNYRTTFFNPTKIRIKFNNFSKEYVGNNKSFSKEKRKIDISEYKCKYKIYLKSLEIVEKTKDSDKENIKSLHTREMNHFFRDENQILNFDYPKYDTFNISIIIDKDKNIYEFLEKYFVDEESEILEEKDFLFEDANKLNFFRNERDIEVFLYLNRIGFLEYDFIDDKKTFSTLSSGEKSFFSDIVILDREIKNFIKDREDTKSLFLIFDEPETTLHPQWQKNLMNEILILLENYAKKQITFHIFITSHSPFILSDLPKENIIFLEKGKQVYPFEDGKQTFGANIHTLLSHGFFMKDGLMGEFAKDKIQSIIKYHEDIEKKEILETDKIEYKTKKQKEFWQIQSIIGDDYLKQVIKNHLVEIEKIVLGNDESKKEEIKRLEAQIEQLRK